MDDLRQIIMTLNIYRVNYDQMKDAGTKGADKYFHAKANAAAVQLGKRGESTAKFLNDIREIFDYYKNFYYKKMSIMAALKDMREDERANAFGQEQGKKYPHTAPKVLVGPLRPKGLKDIY